MMRAVLVALVACLGPPRAASHQREVSDQAQPEVAAEHHGLYEGQVIGFC
jgi:hypothetical protein